METNTLTPAERLTIYEKMLPYFKGEERLASWIRNTMVTGFCHCIDIVSGVPIEEFPELIKHKPHGYSLYWFPRIESCPDHTRTAILHQAINEVKQLINEPAIL